MIDVWIFKDWQAAGVPALLLAPELAVHLESDHQDRLQGVKGDYALLAVGGSCYVILYNWIFI